MKKDAQYMTLAEVFATYPLNASAIARELGINPSLMRQYLCRPDTPISETRKAEIEAALHRLASDLERTHIV